MSLHRIAAGLAVTLLLAGCTSGRAHISGPSPNTGAMAPPPSWAAPADATDAAQRAGLPMLGREMLTVHYHGHLDVIVDGQRIPVPAGLGIDPVRRRISPLHTHDSSGIVHIESGEDIPYTLGQLFTEWGQPLTSRQVGPTAVGGGEVLKVFVNGRVASGDPTKIKWHAHDEDVVWVGPSDQQPTVPSGYPFPSGL